MTTAALLTPKSQLLQETSAQPASLEEEVDEMVHEDINVDCLEEDESADVSGKKGFKAISKEMCETIRVMNPKTNRYKRTFKCLVDSCGRTFAKSCNMAVHLRKHTKEKPYSCTHCDKVFSQSGILSRHLKNVHKEEEKAERKVTITIKSTSLFSEFNSEDNVSADVTKANSNSQNSGIMAY